MLKSISWQEYLTAVVAVTTAYYTVTSIVFYGKDVIHRIKARQKKTGEPSEEASVNRVPGDFMGSIQKDVLRNAVVSESTEVAEEISLAQNRHPSPAEQIIDELNTIFLILSQGPVPKATYSASIGKILASYWRHKGSEVQKEVAEFICDHFDERHDISFSEPEIDILWPVQDLQDNQLLNIYNHETHKNGDQEG